VSVLLKPGHIAEISIDWDNSYGDADLPPAARRVDADAGLVKVTTHPAKKAKKVDYTPFRRQTC
jgi:hypothetical protein